MAKFCKKPGNTQARFPGVPLYNMAEVYQVEDRKHQPPTSSASGVVKMNNGNLNLEQLWGKSDGKKR